MYIMCVSYIIKLNNKSWMKNMTINYVCLYCDEYYTLITSYCNYNSIIIDLSRECTLIKMPLNGCDWMKNYYKKLFRIR